MILSSQGLSSYTRNYLAIISLLATAPVSSSQNGEREAGSGGSLGARLLHSVASLRTHAEVLYTLPRGIWGFTHLPSQGTQPPGEKKSLCDQPSAHPQWPLKPWLWMTLTSPGALGPSCIPSFHLFPDPVIHPGRSAFEMRERLHC